MFVLKKCWHAKIHVETGELSVMAGASRTVHEKATSSWPPSYWDWRKTLAVDSYVSAEHAEQLAREALRRYKERYGPKKD